LETGLSSLADSLPCYGFKQTPLPLRKRHQSAPCAGKHFFDRRQQLMTDAAAQEAKVGVARVVEHLDPQGTAVGNRLLAPDPEQRPGELTVTLAHGDQAPRAGPRQRPHQHRLRLVVGGVTEGDSSRPDPPRLRRQGAAPGFAGSVLQGPAGFDPHRQRSKDQSALPGESPDPISLAGGSRPQPVVDMRDGQPPAAGWSQAGERVEQRCGIRAAAAGDENRLPRLQDASAVGGGGHCAAEAGHRGSPLLRRQRATVGGGGGGSWTRTRDIPGMNRVLYHLS
jgi:hypothetical protein